MRLPRVTLDVHDLTLRQVLDDIAGQTGMTADASPDGVCLFGSYRSSPSPEGLVLVTELTFGSNPWEKRIRDMLRTVIVERGDYRKAPVTEVLDNIRVSPAGEAVP